MMDHEDEYTGIFDDLTVADFERITSAVGGEMERDTQPAFDEFVAEQLRALRTAWIAAETWLQPLAIIANHKRQRAFVPQEDETMGDFIDRVHHEAVKMEAVWTFISKRTLLATVRTASELDVNDPDLWQEGVDQGALPQLGLVWYAERIDTPQHRHGQMIDEDGALGDPKEGPAEQKFPLFAKILNG